MSWEPTSISTSREIAPDALLFRTRNDGRPAASNWARSWQRALRLIGHPPLRVYDCRHAAATTWLMAGVPLGEVARRLGHSVETLVTTYAGVLAGDEALANKRIDDVLSTTGANRARRARRASSLRTETPRCSATCSMFIRTGKSCPPSECAVVAWAFIRQTLSA